MQSQKINKPLILVVGGTGYVGKKLTQRLIESSYPVRCLTRKKRLKKTTLNNKVEVVHGDLLDFESLGKALSGVDIAFYLAHSLDAKNNFEKKEYESANNFAKACRAAGTQRIIFLGALGNAHEAPLSPHLKSRKEVGNILRASGVKVIEFQASIILGSGSLSYEMIKALSEKLPIMIMPQWTNVKSQPICIQDVLDYLVKAIELEISQNGIFEIGGQDQVSYKDLIAEYSRQRKLKRWLFPVPVLTPWLSSLWLSLVTPLYARVGRRLVESIKTPTIVHDNGARIVFPRIKPLGVLNSIKLALIEDGQISHN